MKRILGLIVVVLTIGLLILGTAQISSACGQGKQGKKQGKKQGWSRAKSQFGKGDNRDDLKSGKIDRIGDGNSGQGDDFRVRQGRPGKGINQKHKGLGRTRKCPKKSFLSNKADLQKWLELRRKFLDCKASGRGDNRDDLRSGKIDRIGDGNSGQGDDLHRRFVKKGHLGKWSSWKPIRFCYCYKKIHSGVKNRCRRPIRRVIIRLGGNGLECLKKLPSQNRIRIHKDNGVRDHGKGIGRGRGQGKGRFVTLKGVQSSGKGKGQAIGNGKGGKGLKQQRGNNGVGNGLDPQPPGNPPQNDGPGTSPGNPGNRGGAHRGQGHAK